MTLYALASIQTAAVVIGGCFALTLYCFVSYRAICREDARRQLRRERELRGEAWNWPASGSGSEWASHTASRSSGITLAGPESRDRLPL